MNDANWVPGICRVFIKFDNFYLLNFTHFNYYVHNLKSNDSPLAFLMVRSRKVGHVACAIAKSSLIANQIPIKNKMYIEQQNWILKYRLSHSQVKF